MAEFTTLFGADGTGKTDIAHAYAEYFDTDQVSIIGGSSYHEWLTPEVADTFFGHELSSDLTKKYEEVGVAVYGLATQLKSEGRIVIVDSDSYLKRFAWAMMTSASMDEYEDYAGTYLDFIRRTIGEDSGPDLGVALYPHDRSETDIPQIAEQIIERLTGRGLVTEWDPLTEAEVERNLTACRFVIDTYMKDPHQPHAPAVVADIYNPMVEPARVTTRINEIADEIYALGDTA